MKNCGIRNRYMGHEFALKLLLVGIKDFNHPKIIKYILYFKTVYFNKTCIKCVPCCLATENIDITNSPFFFQNCLVARQP